jgi:hypothetical protein
MLFLVFLMLTLGLFALFLGGAILAQGYLYQNPAEKMPLRAVAAAVLVGGFITLWVAIDRGSPGRYDTFFNFVPYTTTEFQEFEAVRWTGAGGKLTLDANGKPNEVLVKFKRAGKDAKFVEDGGTAPFQMNGSTPTGGQYMTGAIRVKGPNDPEPVRYEATLKEDPRTKEKTFAPETRFLEEKGGSRYVESHKIGTLFVPSTGTIVGALALNLALFVVWLVACWPLMRFSFAHALILAGAFGMLTMLGVMPLLFKQNRAPKPPTTPAPAAMRSYELGVGNQWKS